MSHTNGPAQDIGASAEQLKQKAAQVAESLRELGQQAKVTARDGFGYLRENAQGYYVQGKRKAGEWGESLEQRVQEKPVQSLLIAAGAGLLIGLLLRRK